MFQYFRNTMVKKKKNKKEKKKGKEKKREKKRKKTPKIQLQVICIKQTEM